MGNHQFGLNRTPEFVGKSWACVSEKKQKKFAFNRPNSSTDFADTRADADDLEMERWRGRRAGSEPAEISSKSIRNKRKESKQTKGTVRCSPTVPEALTLSLDLAAAGIGVASVANADAVEAVTSALDAIRKFTPAAPRFFKEPIFDEFFEEAERRNLTMEVLQAALTTSSDDRDLEERHPSNGRSLAATNRMRSKEKLNAIYAGNAEEGERVKDSSEIEGLLSPSVKGRLVLIVANSSAEATEELPPTIIVQPSPSANSSPMNSTTANCGSGALSPRSGGRRGSVSPACAGATQLGVRFADQPSPIRDWQCDADIADDISEAIRFKRKGSARRKTIGGMIDAESPLVDGVAAASQLEIRPEPVKRATTPTTALASSRVVLSQSDDQRPSSAAALPLRKKSLSKSDLLCPPPIITLLRQPQINLIRPLWQQLYTSKGPTVLGNHIFQRVFFKNPQVKDVFRKMDAGNQHINVDFMCKAHAKAVAGILDDVVRNLENLRDVEPKLMDVGRKHAVFYDVGFHINFWSVFAEAFIDCTLEWGEKNRRVEESRKAWAIIIAYITDKMKFGFQEARRNLPRPGRRIRQSDDSDSNAGSAL